MDVIINGLKANTEKNMLYRGVGMVSGNNSSRLLLDYKSQNPRAYNEILEYMFGEKGLKINHLKIEMGSDINSSSGTEPNVKRYADEKADVTRGAGFQLAADARKINPRITLDMLWWSEPKWIENADDVYAARYKWYKETLDAAYETYGLVFDYVSATQNERGWDYEWMKYLSKSLKSEKNCPYDYSKLKIVVGEEVTTWITAKDILADAEKGNTELVDSVDIIGSHYTSRSTPQAKKLMKKYGKELWFSEGSTPMKYAAGARRFDKDKSGLNGINGVLDIANRFISMYPQGKMTLCQFQPVVAAYYDGVCYCHKQFINACDPWSGYYTLDDGFFTMLHFTQFTDKGWYFVDGACKADGKPGGQNGHCIENAVYSFVTLCDPEKNNYSTIITNTTDEPITYDFTVRNLGKAGEKLYVWETRGSDNDKYNENFFRPVSQIIPIKKGKSYVYSVTVKPGSIVTISTIDLPVHDYTNKSFSERKILSLPYRDNFDYDEKFLSSRGCAPLYTTDEGGAFEVTDGKLVQQITAEEKAREWGWTPDPVTNFGDDRWYNYSISAEVSFSPAENKNDNYVGVGMRYIQGHRGASGYWLKLTESGSWSLWKNNKVLKDGSIGEVSGAKLTIKAIYETITCFINDKQVCEYVTQNESSLGAGRGALFSSYNKNSFSRLEILPIDGINPYITRCDNTDMVFSYEGDWKHDTLSGFCHYKRTISTGEKGCKLTLNFHGEAVALLGEQKENAKISYSIDGGKPLSYDIPVAEAREINLFIDGLSNSRHTLEVTVTDGSYSVDSAEFSSDFH